MKIGDMSEEEIINRIIKPLLNGHELDLIDDAIAERIGANFIVLNVDTLIGSTDILPGSTPFDVGWKATVMTMSDVIAKGSTPFIFANSISIESDRELDYLRGIFEGIRSACSKYNALLVGGDLNESKDLSITGVGVGLAKKVVPRSGAKPGEEIWVTGEFGYNGVAFHYLLDKGESVENIEIALNWARRPPITITSGEPIAEVATSSMDSSDGLAYTLNTMAKASKVKFVIEHIPIPKIVEEYADKNRIDPLELALYAGEEFHIVFTTSLGEEEVIRRLKNKAGLSPIRIGRVERGEGVYYGDKRLEKRGWQHFKRG